MSDVKERLISFAEAVMSQFDLPEEDWERVNEIIMENTLLEPTMIEQDVVDFFTANIICPHCNSLLGNKCSCFDIERT